MPGTEEPSPYVQCVEAPAAEALAYWVTYTNALYDDGWRLQDVAGNGFSFVRTDAESGCTAMLGFTFNPRRDEPGAPVILSFDTFPDNNSCGRAQ